MIAIVAPRFELTECNSAAEKSFIGALHQRAEVGNWCADSWPRDDRVMLSFSASDSKHRLVLTTLRIDFDGTSVWFGPDETHQFATDLNAQRPGVTMLTGLPIHKLANASADWLEREMRRPIQRHEWDRLDARGVAPRLWVLADTGEPIAAMGNHSADFGPPDRIVDI